MRTKCLFLVLILVTSVASAQSIHVPADAFQNMTITPDPNTYGTLSETSLTVSSFAFDISFQGITWGVLDYMRYVSNSFGCCLVAPVTLPGGALIVGVELEACDDSATGAVIGNLLRCPVPGGSCIATGPQVSTGDANVPGCGTFRAHISPGQTVDNLANSYMVQVGNNGDLSGNARFRSVRIYYKLQVSQPPGSATFTDVPTTHLFYQYIEALAAAGITSGCGGGNYCPDAAVTRGQMAVFLAKALGLHWTP